MPRYRLLGRSICFLFVALLSCQAVSPTPTLQPDETEVPFETVVLDSEGWTEIAQGPQLYALTSADEMNLLQNFIEPAATQQIQQVDFNIYNILAFFRVPGRGCAGYGVTVDRLVHRANTLTVFATDWELTAGGACGETTSSAYHIVAFRKEDVNIGEVELVLQSQRKVREEWMEKQLRAVEEPQQ